jgi:hypothetical protein
LLNRHVPFIKHGIERMVNQLPEAPKLDQKS